MDEQFYTNYFQGLAERNKAISHIEGQHKSFFVIDDVNDMKEVQESIRKTLKTPALLLEVFEDDLTDKGSDNNMECYYGALAVVIRVSTKDTVAIRTARQQARAIAKQIVFKIKRDGMYGVLAAQNIIAKLDSKGFPVGPVADNCYGWRYAFTWYSPVITAENPDEWNS
jgi:hypothetical protein